jgi:NAD(P)H-dependent flavin oxidoreductase YrpB (nitropropane dioxygenase family)
MAGQSAGLVDAVIPVQELVEQLIHQAEEAIRRSAAQLV